MRVTVLVLAACGSTPSTTHEVVKSQPPAICPPLTVAPPKTFGHLFCAGAAWKLQGSTSSGPNPEGDNPVLHTEVGTLTCSVAFPKQLAGGWSADLECSSTSRLIAEFPKHLIATPLGVWDRSGDDLAKLDPKARVLTEPPREGQYFGQLGPEGGENRSVERRGDAWCFSAGSGGMGYSQDWTLCVRDGDIVGARSIGNDNDGQVTGVWGILEPRD